MGLFTQINHAIQFVVNDSGFDKDYLMLERCDYEEFSTGLYAIHVTLLSHDKAIDPNKLLYCNATASIRMDEPGLFADDKNIRYFNGVITQFSSKGHRSDDLYVYEAQLQSSCSLLRYRKNSRIFKEETVPQIVTKVCKELGEWTCTIDDSKLNKSKHQKREVCAQYQETDLAFIIRLLQDDGIYLYFRHEEASHTMYLADSPAQEEDELIDKVYRYGKSDDRCIYDWHQDRQAMVQEVCFNSYNPDSPKKDLATKSLVDKNSEVKLPPLIANEHREVYWDRKDGEQKARQLSSVLEGQMDVAEVHSNYLDLERNRYFLLQAPGYDYLNDKKFLITSVRYQFFDGSYSQQDQSNSGLEIFNSFQCIPEGRMPFPMLKDVAPKIFSTHTAKVVSESLDDQGRVEILFRWDQLKNTIRARVQQEMTGDQCGDFRRPLVDQEVLVSFLEGNPNFPVITGCLYNKDNLPKFDPSANQTKRIFSDAALNRIVMDQDPGNKQLLLEQDDAPDDAINHLHLLNEGEGASTTVELINGENFFQMTSKGGADECITLANNTFNELKFDTDKLSLVNNCSGTENKLEMNPAGVTYQTNGLYTRQHDGNIDETYNGSMKTVYDNISTSHTFHGGTDYDTYHGYKVNEFMGLQLDRFFSGSIRVGIGLSLGFTVENPEFEFKKKLNQSIKDALQIDVGGSAPAAPEASTSAAAPVSMPAAPSSAAGKNSLKIDKTEVLVQQGKDAGDYSKLNLKAGVATLAATNKIRVRIGGSNSPKSYIRLHENDMNVKVKNFNAKTTNFKAKGSIKLG